MEIKLSRKDMEVAVKCFIVQQGVDLNNKSIEYTFGREIVTVELTDNLVENDKVNLLTDNSEEIIMEKEFTLEPFIKEE